MMESALQPLFLVYNACSGLPAQILWIDRVVVLLITGLSQSDGGGRVVRRCCVSYITGASN